MDPELPEEIRLLQRTVRAFVDEVLAPCAQEIEEKDEIPRALIAKMGEAGLFGIGHAEELGGQGFGKLGYCVAVEQLGRVNASLWNVLGGSAGLCGTAIAVGAVALVTTFALHRTFAGRDARVRAIEQRFERPIRGVDHDLHVDAGKLAVKRLQQRRQPVIARVALRAQPQHALAVLRHELQVVFGPRDLVEHA